MKTKQRKLTPRQKQFVKEYVIDLNATQAYIRAGFSAKSARTLASRLLANDNIQAALKTAMDARAKRTEITGDDVVNDLRLLADMALGRKPTKKAVMVDGEVIEAEVFEVNGPVANTALASLGRHFGIFEKDQAQDINALFISGIRQFITQEATLPRDRVDDRLGNGVSK